MLNITSSTFSMRVLDWCFWDLSARTCWSVPPSTRTDWY